jgi:hypothetical protein
MRRFIVSTVLIFIGLACLYLVYFDSLPRESLKAEELIASDFFHVSGWIMLGVGTIIGISAIGNRTQPNPN